MDATTSSRSLKKAEDAYSEKTLTHSRCIQFYLVVSQQSRGKLCIDQQRSHLPTTTQIIATPISEAEKELLTSVINLLDAYAVASIRSGSCRAHG